MQQRCRVTSPHLGLGYLQVDRLRANEHRCGPRKDAIFPALIWRRLVQAQSGVHCSILTSSHNHTSACRSTKQKSLLANKADLDKPTDHASMKQLISTGRFFPTRGVTISQKCGLPLQPSPVNTALARSSRKRRTRLLAHLRRQRSALIIIGVRVHNAPIGRLGRTPCKWCATRSPMPGLRSWRHGARMVRDCSA